MSFLALISPAKRLDFEATHPDLPLRSPEFAAQARTLIKIARAWSAEDIAARMKLSENLATLNHQRYQDFKMRGAGGARQAAMFAFAGDVYQGLDASSLTTEQVLAAQECLRILSGLYGLLRPLDVIQPYRLEMGTRVDTDAGSTLYAFWGTKISKALNSAATETGAHTLLNLASQEYFGAVDQNALKFPILNCHFKEMRDGQAKIISFNAKRARGLMARFLIENSPKTVEDLQTFRAEGYAFAPELSDATNLTFLK